MAVSQRSGDSIAEVADALRRVAEREVRHVIFSTDSRSPYYVQFTTDPGVFWGEVVCDRTLRRKQRLAEGSARLEALGWRPPAAHIPNWFQYFHLTRKRHYGELAEHVARTFRDGLGADGEVGVFSIDRSPPAEGPTFVVDDEVAQASDGELLELVARVLRRFEPSAYPGHLEVTMRRKRQRVRIAITACQGTISCAALYLPAALPEVVDAAFAVSDRLDAAPYTYAVRTVAGHGDSLVLLSKVAVMEEQRNPFVLAMLLYNTIEPLLAAHRALHDGSRG